MENKFVIDFNGHWVETDLSDKPKVSEELEDEIGRK